MAFLHGVETINVQKGAVTVQSVRTAVIGLVGIAPKGDANTLTVISSAREGVETFGAELPGFTIPQSLSAIFAQGGAQVVVINVFDEGDHTDPVTAEEHQVVNGKITLPNAPVGSTFSVKNSGGTVTYTEGTHYSRNEYGVITILDLATIPNGTTLEVTYKRLALPQVLPATIIGTAGINATGMQLWDRTQANFGFAPKILICPTFTELEGVATELIERAEALRAICLLDAPSGTSVAEAISARGANEIEGWTSSSYRVIPVFPQVRAFDPATNGEQVRPYGPYLAGVIAAKDVSKGYWWSPSNTEIKGITGTELPITASINDINSEANQLNAAGITTVFNAFGTGFRTWGNRSAAFPANTDVLQFVNVRRTADILNESVEFAMLQFLDRPLNQALIDAIRDTVNGYIRTLVARGAVIDGVCTFDPDKNPDVELAAGHLVFDISFMPPVPAERITFQSFVDITYLNTLV